MVCVAIVVRLGPAQGMQEVASISRKSVLLFSFYKHFDEFSEINAISCIPCAGSRRTTIATQTIFETSESCGFTKNRIRAFLALFLTFFEDYEIGYYIRM